MVGLCATVFLLLASFGPGPALAQTRSTRTWTNPKARELAREGIEAKKAGDIQLCIQKDQASLALEEHPYVRLHLSTCLSSTGKIVDALKSAQLSLSAAVKADDEDLRPAAEARVRELLPKIAHVILKLPPEDDDIKVRFDGIPVRKALFRQSIPVDPGDHLIEAQKIQKGEELKFKADVTLADGEEKTIEVVLEPNNLPEGTRECLEKAKTYEEKLACIEQKKTTPNVRIGIEISGYTDSTATHVFTPAINAAVVSPTGGWNVGGSYLLDVVTAASPDIVSMASGRFRESRHAGSLTGGYKFGDVSLQGSTNVSREPDYLSITGGLAASAEVMDKHVTPRLAYALTADTIGIRSTPFSQYKRNLTTHEIEAGVTMVVSPTTLLVTGLTARLESGEQSKLYRYVPLFDAATLPSIQPGASVEDVNAKRLDARPRELLPSSRNRFAIGARLNHRFTSSTIRVEERLYADTWKMFASTTDARWLYDLSPKLRVWPHARFHFQNGASFYQLAYLGDVSSGQLQTFSYRTGDRELSRMFTLTFGGGARYELSGEKATTKWAVFTAGEIMLSKFTQSLYVTSRTAFYGTLGLEVEL